MIIVKLTASCLLKITLFLNEFYDVITTVYDFTKKFLSGYSSCIIDLPVWLRFGSTSISMKQVIITSNL